MRASWPLRALVICACVLSLSSGCGRGDPTAPAASKGRPNPSAAELAAMRREFERNTLQRTLPQSPAPAVSLVRQWGVKDTAADALARIGLDAVPALVKALSDPVAEVRARAAEALARMGPDAKSAVPALIKALEDTDRNVRLSAARALGQIGPDAEAAIPALVRMIQDPTADNVAAQR